MIYDNYLIMGTCSLCGGPVVVPSVTWSVILPTPRCRDCGAVPANNYGPKIDMVPPGKRFREYNTRICGPFYNSESEPMQSW